jgi:WASH complex subunit FAM21
VTLLSLPIVLQVGSLVADTQRTNVMLRNTVNEFLLLSNTQFIESRVWGEDERNKSDVKPEESAATSADAAVSGEQVIDQRYRDAIGLGMSALSLTEFGRPPKPVPVAQPEAPDGAAPAAEAPVEESSEDEGANDRFNRRPLPFVIGTEEFDEDDHVGLFDPDAPESEEPAEAAGAMNDDDEEDDSDSDLNGAPAQPLADAEVVVGAPQSADQVIDAGAVEGSAGIPAAPHMQADVQQPSDDASGQQGGAPSAAEMGGQGPPRTLADELASRLGVAPAARPEASAEVGGAAPPSVAVPAAEPEPVANSDPFAAASGSAWGASLFEETSAAPVDIFATSSKGMFDTESIFAASGPAPTVDIFSATVDDIFGTAPPQQKTETKAAAAPAAASAAAADVFSGDIFGSAPPPAAVSAPAPAAARKPAPSTDLFGEPVLGGGSADDIFGAFEPPAVAKKEPPPVIAATAVVAAAAPASDSSVSSVVQEAAPAAAAARKPPPGAVNLFGGVDLFGGNAPGTPSLSRDRARSSSISAEKKASRPSTPSNLPPAPFAASEPVLADAPAPAASAPVPAGPKKPAGAVSLFGGVDLFGSSPSDTGNLFAAPKKPAAPATSSLFGDSDLFGSSPKKETAKKPASSDLFGTSPQTSSAIPAPAAAKKAAAPPSSSGLFGDDSDFGSLFAVPAPAKAAEKPAAKIPEKVAEPAAVQEEEPSESSPPPSAAAAAPPQKKGPAGAVSLFGGVDLFGGASPAIGKKGDRPPPPKSSPSPPTTVPVPAASAAAATTVPAVKAAPAKASLFGDDGDGGLFAPIKPAASSTSTAAPSKPGLFGDDDLFSVKPKAAAASKPSASLFGSSPVSGGDLFAPKPAVVAVRPTPSVAEPVVASPLSKTTAFADPLSGSPKGKIAALGAGINFNPAMLSGAGRPPPKAEPVVEVRLTESGLEISNAGARLGDEATQGAKSKATLRRKGARRAPTRKKADDDWDEDDDDGKDESPSSSALPSPAVAVAVAAVSAAPLSAASAPIAAAARSVASTPAVAPTSDADIFGSLGAFAAAPTADIFGDGAAAAPDIFGDVPSIF